MQAPQLAAANAGVLSVAQYDWRQPFPLTHAEIASLGRDRPAFDFIVATDVLFSEEIVPLLVAVLLSLCDETTQVPDSPLISNFP